MTNDFDRTCGKLASALTAYFDGQATPAEVLIARAHLRDCQSCAELWLAWHEGRALLSGDATQTPPHLAQRILMACRMDALRRVTAPRAKSNKATGLPPEVVAMRLGLHSFDNFRNDETDIAIPAHLLESILNQTTRSDGSRAALSFESDATGWNSNRAILQDEMLLPLAVERRFNPTSGLRRTFSLAVPAAFLWMMWPGSGVVLAPESATSVSEQRVATPAEHSANSVSEPASSRFASPVAIRAAGIAADDAKPSAKINPVEIPARDNSESPASERAASERQPRIVALPSRLVERQVARADAGDTSESRISEAQSELPPAPRAIGRPRVAPDQPRVAMTVIAPRENTRLRFRSPRMLTTVSFVPVAMRSGAVASAGPREESRSAAAAAAEARAAEARAAEAESSDDSSSLDGRFLASSAIDSYRAALAEVVDDVPADG